MGMGVDVDTVMGMGMCMGTDMDMGVATQQHRLFCQCVLDFIVNSSEIITF